MIIVAQKHDTNFLIVDHYFGDRERPKATTYLSIIWRLGHLFELSRYATSPHETAQHSAVGYYYSNFVKNHYFHMLLNECMWSHLVGGTKQDPYWYYVFYNIVWHNVSLSQAHTFDDINNGFGHCLAKHKSFIHRSKKRQTLNRARDEHFYPLCHFVCVCVTRPPETSPCLGHVFLTLTAEWAYAGVLWLGLPSGVAVFLHQFIFRLV